MSFVLENGDVIPTAQMTGRGSYYDFSKVIVSSDEPVTVILGSNFGINTKRIDILNGGIHAITFVNQGGSDFYFYGTGVVPSIQIESNELIQLSRNGSFDQYVGAQKISSQSTTPQVPSDSDPLMDGEASAGESTSYSRGDHVHPSDDAKEDHSNKKAEPNWASDTDFPTAKAADGRASTYQVRLTSPTTGSQIKALTSGNGINMALDVPSGVLTVNSTTLIRQKSECYFSGLDLTIPTTATNLINLIKSLAHTGSLAPFFDVATNKFAVFNENTTVTFKLNIVGSWTGASTNRSMTVNFPQTNGNSLTQSRDAAVTTDILSFPTFFSVDKNGSLATSGSDITIQSNGATFTATSILIVAEQMVPVTTAQ